jgi:hypothetical protein
MQYNTQTYEFQHEGDTRYVVRCPAHGKVYDGTLKHLAVTIQYVHDECVPTADENLMFAFSTVTGRHTVQARFMGHDDLVHGARYSRAYVTVSDEEVGGERPPYGSQRGDGSDEDKAWKKYNRLELNTMKLKLGLVTEVLQAGGYLRPEPGARWNFSRNAGCSCGCSPGFVRKGTRVSGYYRGSNHFPADVWVS